MHALPWWFGLLINPWTWISVGVLAVALLALAVWGLIRWYQR